MAVLVAVPVLRKPRGDKFGVLGEGMEEAAALRGDKFGVLAFASPVLRRARGDKFGVLIVDSEGRFGPPRGEIFGVLADEDPRSEAGGVGSFDPEPSSSNRSAQARA